MCGIIAVVGNKIESIDDSVINGMLSCLSKRGPDEKAFVRFNDAILGQTRLSIIDLAGGHQPMKDSKRDFTIVFNGEIYGYKETRKNLESLGHTFNTNSDTEVILKAYAQYGKDCPTHLDGMFAFALWDGEKKELFIARDRFGKKPLYHAFVNNTFILASEIKSIFSTNLIKGKIDPTAIDDYLRLMYVPSYKTIYENIGILPPAYAGIIKDGSLHTWRYWKLEKKNFDLTYEEAKKRIKELFSRAVEKRMVADVEIGSLLSGGVDSTLVTLEAQKHMDRPIKTFSVGYGSHIDELPFAQEASKKIGTDHYTLQTENVDLDALKEVMVYFDEPHADSSNYPQALVSKLASSKVKVALSGDGADELFLGYGWYQKYWHTPFLKRLISNHWKAYRQTTEVFSKKERIRLTGIKKSNILFENEILNGKHGIEKINVFDLNIYLPGQLLTKVDRTSMMHSLEIRSPFLDTALAEFVYSLPTHFKLSKSSNKIILKDILAEVFPKEFVYRRKQGFGAPVAIWLADKAFTVQIQEILNDTNKPVWKYVSRSMAQEIQKDAMSDLKNKGYKLWSIICLALWFDSHSQFHDN